MKVRSLVPMAVLGLYSLIAAASAENLRQHAMQGGDLNPQQVAILEEKVAADPHDLVARSQLLGYYFYRKYNGDRLIPEKRKHHILWLIRNAPEAEILAYPYVHLDRHLETGGYQEARKAWHDQIAKDPNNPTILYHAAKAFTLSDRELAIQLLLKAQSLDGHNPKWARELGHLYELDRRGGSDDDNVKLAEKALTQFERAYELTDGAAREVFLVNLAKNAFVAGQYAKAREYAEAALHDNSSGWNHGNRTHWGHLTLGRIAFAEGNIEEAKYRLIAAAMIQGSPQLNSFGPDMTLAEELLEACQKDVVLKYFELCAVFWESGQDDLADWTALVKFDRKPDFSRNLKF